MSKRLLMAVAAVALALSACGSSPSLERGKVVAKEYDDADDWYQAGYTIDGGQYCTGGYNGQPKTCHDNPDTNIPGQWHHAPERFLLELRGPNPDDDTKTISDTIEVPESFFNEVRVGQWIDVDSLEIIPR